MNKKTIEKMKQIKLFPFLYLIASMLIISACSSEENSEDSSAAIQTNALKVELDSLNKSILEQLGRSTTRGASCNCNRICTKSCSCSCKVNNQQQQAVDTVDVILQDGAGFLAGAAAGAQIGGSIGTFSLPLIGTISAGGTLGFLGGLLGAVAASWHASKYETTIGETGTELDSTSVLYYSNVIGLINKSAFVDTIRTKKHLLKSTPQNNSLIVSEQLYKMSSLHNTALELMNDSSEHGAPYKYIAAIPNNDVIDSLEVFYNSFVNENCIDELFVKPATNSTDKEHIVFYSFAEIFYDEATSRPDAEKIIEMYAKQVWKTHNLTNQERVKLLYSLYVCWHSYNYWKE